MKLARIVTLVAVVLLMSSMAMASGNTTTGLPGTKAAHHVHHKALSTKHHRHHKTQALAAKHSGALKTQTAGA
jgi:predicted small secreted protein